MRDPGPGTGRKEEDRIEPLTEHPMASKKKSKGVLERISDAAAAAAGVVIDAGSKAMHAVGGMMPTGTTQNTAKASPRGSKVKRAKRSAKRSKAANAPKPQEMVETKTKTAAPKARKTAMKKTTPAKSAKPVSSPKAKRSAGKKG